MSQDSLQARSLRSKLVRAPFLALFACVPLALASCATLTVDPLPAPSPPAIEPEAEGTAAPQEQSGQLEITRAPGVVIQHSVAEGMADELGSSLVGDPIQVSFHDMPLMAFINEVFYNELGMSFTVGPSLRERRDLVTLRFNEPLPPAQLFATATSVLREYGVDLRQRDGLLTFVPSEDARSKDVPLLVSGRTLPEVPPSHRTIFQLVPIKVVESALVRNLLRDAFEDYDELYIEQGDLGNSLLLMGPRTLIERALPMIEVLDQPLLHGRNGVIVAPNFISPNDLARALRQVLEAEGYWVSENDSDGSIIFVPLDEMNKLVVFTVDAAALAHVEKWTRILDEERREEVDDGVFAYQVRHKQAEGIVTTLNLVAGGRDGGRQSQNESSQSQSQSGSGGLVVDKGSNMILFRGSGKEWGELLRLLHLLDRPVPSVLIEVMVAEVTLTDLEGSGLEFLLNASAAGKDAVISTIGKLGLRSSGLSTSLNSAGQVRAMISFFNQDSKVVIRSSPKVVVKSGDAANIEVGNEIPVIVQTTEEGTLIGGSTNVLQQVSYRKTGIQMEITAVVRANGFVDLTVSLTLSEARPSDSASLDGSPAILNRSVSTSHSLRDGGSVLIGGLTSTSRSLGHQGVPVLGKIPVLGRLFRSELYQEDRTELVVMVIPYVVTDHRQALDMTERVRQQLELHPLEDAPGR